MPEFLERKLKAKYGQDSDIPFKIMNKLKFMKGNKETPKGKAAQEAHEDKKKSSSKVDSATKLKMLSKME